MLPRPGSGFVRPSFCRTFLRGLTMIRKATRAASSGGATRAGSFADGGMVSAEKAWNASGGHVHGGTNWGREFTTVPTQALAHSSLD